MKKMISERFAVNGMLALLTLIVLFHMLVLTGIIPFTIIGGGRITNTAEMIRLELPAVLINLLMLGFVAVRAGLLRWNIPPKTFRIGFWVLFVIFFLNTFGNLLSVDTFEKMVFTPLTILLALFSLRLALHREEPV